MIDWCLTCQFEDYDESEEPCINCVSDTEVESNAKPTEYFPKRPPKPITNADKLRSMSDENLARFITGEDLCELLCGSPPVCDGCWSCEGKMLAWLKAPAEEGET